MALHTLTLAALVACFFVVVVPVVCSLPSSREEVQDAFRRFLVDYRKEYTEHSEEGVKRLAYFAKNMERARQLQDSEQGTGRYGVTPFADLSEQEFLQQYTNAAAVGETKEGCLQHGVTEASFARLRGGSAAPDSFDWRDKGAVNPVRNQGQCGSCWAFSTVENIEGQAFLATGKLQILAPQGCGGGWQWNAYEHVMKEGLQLDVTYPYTAADGKCVEDASKSVVHISNYTCYGPNEVDLLDTLVSKGPLAIAMNAGWLQLYMGGISDPLWCNAKHLDHALLLVGYGKEGSKDYWTIKNSWGEHWGEKGYFKLKRGDNKCGVANAVSSADI